MAQPLQASACLDKFLVMSFSQAAPRAHELRAQRNCGSAAGARVPTRLLLLLRLSDASQMVDGRFSDYRWKNGRWDLSLFK